MKKLTDTFAQAALLMRSQNVYVLDIFMNSRFIQFCMRERKLLEICSYPWKETSQHKVTVFPVTSLVPSTLIRDFVSVF